MTASYALGDRVVATVLPPGADRPAQVRGTVWGINRGETYTFDVMTDDRQWHPKLHAADLRTSGEPPRTFTSLPWPPLSPGAVP